MNKLNKLNGDALRARVSADMADSIDEELDTEIDDDRLDKLLLKETFGLSPSGHSLVSCRISAAAGSVSTPRL
jgi:hypothetical protein